MEPGDSSDDCLPTADWARLRLRADLLARTRSFFEKRGFLEVETPLLSADVVVDRYLEPIAVSTPDDHSGVRPDRTLWLQTSPEFGMKRLMAAGGEAIYQITRAFRGGEVGPLHNREFTIVEWYRRGHTMAEGMQCLSDLSEALLQRGPAEQTSYAEVFEAHVGVCPHRATTLQLREAAARHGVHVSDSFGDADRDNWLNVLLAQVVEPHLGAVRPTIVHGYPASQAALAQVTGDPPIAERFELYVRGIELANGYHELTDAAVLRERNRLANQQRVAEGKRQLPEESRLLAAMERGLPDCTGVALGFDRVVMLAAGATRLSDIMAFPSDRA